MIKEQYKNKIRFVHKMTSRQSSYYSLLLQSSHDRPYEVLSLFKMGVGGRETASRLRSRHLQCWVMWEFI